MARAAEVLKFAASIVICQLAALVGSLFTAPAITSWYVSLNKPWFTPPNWAFAPVWTTLFILMGVSLFLVWRKGMGDKKVKLAVGVFGVQLILNIFWSVIFFGLRFPLGGFIEIVILWIAILFTILKFYNISKQAGLLLVPYIVWVSIAGALNLSVIFLNP